jgi:hypothetical protein
VFNLPLDGFNNRPVRAARTPLQTVRICEVSRAADTEWRRPRFFAIHSGALPAQHRAITEFLKEVQFFLQ